MTGNPVKAFEMKMIRKDDTTQISEVSISLIRNTEGNPIAFRVISRDITEQKQMEETIREYGEKYKTVIRILPSAIGWKKHFAKVRKNIEPFLKASRKAILRLILPVNIPFSTIQCADSWLLQRGIDGYESPAAYR